MEIENAIIISLTTYKITSLLVGLISIYMGYNLFIKGIWGQAGDLDMKFQDNRLILKKAAPGTFFALFGAIIISITLWKGLEFNKYSNSLESGSKKSDEFENKIQDLPDVPPIK
ncbi:hypothetical protein [Cyclobacterium amurskyense]|uniref:Uncharacterized protein n=1 Tax=Cyclobacterium amurskyense TaxID=320787 RepID=A0A0H4PDC6_9BACT|nr:hypothetical protein [Cyclobacterium amurskyense]AKP50833.1 hypothetical protein CA2015_1390 [Cyclobacterium amurskyense]